jgi:integrase/recombinase XerD
MKKIRENITQVEHKKILTFLNGDTTIRANTKQNLLVTFTLLYYTGVRVNELTQLKIKDLKEIIKTKELIIKTHKTKRERKLFFSKDAIKDIGKLFDYLLEDNESYIIRSKGNVSKSPHELTFINTVNKFIQKALNSNRYSSHSYRAGLITDMSKSINTKFISQYIGHSDIKTTMKYIKATDSDLKECIIR